jgi:glycosyltransferase involved in cell wall biosynthesis
VKNINEREKHISIIIPIYNEKNNILKSIADISKAMDNGFVYELILVDDGSTDGSSEVIDKITLPNVKKVSHLENKGYGAAIKSGIRNAQNNIIVIVDADGTYPYAYIPKLLNNIDKYAMVVGARVGRKVKIPLIRRPAKWFITKLACYLTETRIPDLNSGMRVMKRDVVEKFMHLLPNGFSFTSTITLAMLTNDYLVEYVPIDYFKRQGKSKIRPVKDTLNFLQLIIRTVLYFNPLRVFLPLSMFFVFLAFLVLFGTWYFLGKAADVTFGVILTTAIEVLIVGMLADLIVKRVK